MLKDFFDESMEDAVAEQKSQIIRAPAPSTRKSSSQPTAPPEFDGEVQCDPIVIRFQADEEEDEDDFDDFDDGDFDDDFDDDFEEIAEDEIFDDLDDDIADGKTGGLPGSGDKK